MEPQFFFIVATLPQKKSFREKKNALKTVLVKGQFWVDFVEP